MVKIMIILAAGVLAFYFMVWLVTPLQTSGPKAARNLAGKATGFPGCYRCGDSWSWKLEHQTRFSETESCFPLCEECWSALTPAARWPYYEALIADWVADEEPDARQLLYLTALGEPPKAELIREAVMAGK
jgi:hypothetical protein